VDEGQQPDDPPDDGVAAALAALEQVELTLSFDPDAAIASFRGHALVEQVARQVKGECRAHVLQQVARHAAAGVRHTLH
jgi:hypothetical protein